MNVLISFFCGKEFQENFQRYKVIRFYPKGLRGTNISIKMRTVRHTAIRTLSVSGSWRRWKNRTWRPDGEPVLEIKKEKTLKV